MIVLAPGIWAAHFLASYLTAAIWCAKYAGPSDLLTPVRLAICVYTILALAGLSITGWVGRRRFSFDSEEMPHDDATPVDRHRFLGFTLLLLSVLSAVATLFVAAVILFVRTCD